VFVSNLDGRTFGLSANTGKVVWRYAKGRYTPGIASDRYYYFTLRNLLIVLRGEHSPREQD
jgi:hypothetical protein